MLAVTNCVIISAIIGYRNNLQNNANKLQNKHKLYIIAREIIKLKILKLHTKGM